MPHKVKRHRLLVALGLLSCIGTPLRASDDAEELKTAEIVSHHWKTFRDNDLEGTLADYTDESILITPNRIYKGMQELRENFVAAFRLYPKDTAVMHLNKSVVQRNVGYILWDATGPRMKLSYGTDTFVIKNGKIVTQTFAGVPTPL